MLFLTWYFLFLQILLWLCSFMWLYCSFCEQLSVGSFVWLDRKETGTRHGRCGYKKKEREREKISERGRDERWRWREGKLSDAFDQVRFSHRFCLAFPGIYTLRSRFDQSMVSWMVTHSHQRDTLYFLRPSRSVLLIGNIGVTKTYIGEVTDSTNQVREKLETKWVSNLRVRQQRDIEK